MMSELASENSNSLQSQRPRWRPQVSLATFLLLVTIVALVVSHFVTYFRLQKEAARNDALAKEVATYKKMLGMFDITNPNLIHAMQMSSDDTNVTRYRIYYPPNRRYMIKVGTKSIPQTGNPGEFFAMSAVTSNGQWPANDEILVKYHDDKVTITSRAHGSHGQTTSQLPKEAKEATGSFSNGVNATQVSIQEPGQPFLVIRKRDSTGASYSSDDKGPTKSGLMIWLEEVSSTGAPISTPTPINVTTPPPEKSNIEKK